MIRLNPEARKLYGLLTDIMVHVGECEDKAKHFKERFENAMTFGNKHDDLVSRNVNNDIYTRLKLQGEIIQILAKLLIQHEYSVMNANLTIDKLPEKERMYDLMRTEIDELREKGIPILLELKCLLEKNEDDDERRSAELQCYG